MTQTVDFSVTGENPIHCAGCEQRISNALKRLPGVASVEASAKTQRVRVAFDPAQMSVAQLRDKLERAGFAATPEGRSV